MNTGGEQLVLSSTDGSHYKKYITTLGVAIVAGSLGLTGYILQSQNDLLIESTKLRSLTPEAQEAIQHKQAIALQIAIYGPWMCAILVLIGVVLVAHGLRGWSQRQKVLDRKEDLEIGKLNVELQQLSKSEILKKAEEEALEVLAEQPPEKDHDPELGSPDDHTGEQRDDLPVLDDLLVPRPPRPGRLRAPSDDRSRDSVLRRIVDAERLLGEKLAAMFGPKRTMVGARIKAEGRRPIELDALVIPSTTSRGFVFELTHMGDESLARKNALNRMQSVLRTCAAAMTIDHSAHLKPGSTIPVIIFLADGNIEEVERITRNAYNSIEDGLADRPAILVYQQDEFADLPPAELIENARMNYGGPRS